MMHRIVWTICLLWDFGFFHEGLTALIETRQTVTAAVREDAHLTCQLMETKDVVQVTWNKHSAEGWIFLASYTSKYGQRVTPDFRGKVEFTDAALQTTSIVLKNVTDQDEGCYQCVFNTDPEGAFRAQTCLQVYELYEPILHVEPSDCSEQAVVSCSAAGRPAPTVTLSVLQQDLHLSNHSSVSVANTNGTVTVTATAVLSGFHGNATQVGCVVQVLSGPQKDTFLMIPGVKLSSSDGCGEEPGPDNDSLYFILIIVFVSMGVSLVCVSVFMKLTMKHKLKNRDPENITTPQKTVDPTDEPKTPLIQDENQHVRQRKSSEKKANIDPKTLSSPARCTRSLFT